ncbi:conserved hypothetical protein [Rubrivivax sp. A210]|uniref:alpha/beta hydrolase n=1 Tax=Rubrivivax sp. A210 TaxID=2772301 RepID=UPI00191898A8|nr:alpha/beta hydrolase [Rubrivivax sp. A210]CAD5373736.1 conserved hypothetical protein [Rubrivivax sp. A210]
MSRHDEDFPGYVAGLQLDMREQPEGGSVHVPCQPIWAFGQVRSQQDLLVLVHGFNNNRREAQEAYAAFRKRQAGLLEARHLGAFEDMLGDAFWPGDANFAGPLDMLDFLVYPATIATAKLAAAQLSTYLLSRRDVLNLYFVGHSMGCRVILETLRLLKANPSFRTPVRKVCLLAAAVRTSAVFPGGALEEAFRAAEQVEVLHSSADTVLSLAFPIGQTAAGDGFFPTAIGRHGDVPRNPGQVEIRPVDGAGHGDYWGWRPTDQSAVAAEHISRFLGLGQANRDLPTATIPQCLGPQPREDIKCRQFGD